MLRPILPPALAPKLDPLIRRLGTNHDGEKLATLAALERTLATARADFHDLADAVVAGVKPRIKHRTSPHHRRASPPDVATMLDDLLDRPELSDWQFGFVDSVYGQFCRRRRLSDKQIDVLERIWRQYEGRAA